VKVGASITVPGRISEAEQVWFDPARWPSWVEGFGHVASLDDSWPEPGARLAWDSRPGGRGRVLETVVRREPRVEQVLDVEHGRIRGTQTVRFEGAGTDRARIALELDYRIKQRNPLTGLVDLLFVRRVMRDSLRRTLARFATELRAQTELP
jgi:uncharacterized membrane protein